MTCFHSKSHPTTPSQGIEWSVTWKLFQIIFPWTETKFQLLFWSYAQQSKPVSATVQLKAYLTELPAQQLRQVWMHNIKCFPFVPA